MEAIVKVGMFPFSLFLTQVKERKIMHIVVNLLLIPAQRKVHVNTSILSGSKMDPISCCLEWPLVILWSSIFIITNAVGWEETNIVSISQMKV